MSLAEIAPVALRVVLILGGVYLLLCALLWALQDKLIFHPQKLAATPNHPAAEPIAIARGDAVLRGWAVNADAAPGTPLVLYSGGNAEEVSAHIDAFAHLAATTLLVNYRGYGESDGAPSEKALVEDAVAIVEWGRERFPDRPLVLFGLSLGSGVVTLAAPSVKPDAAILVSPYRSVEQIARSTYPIFPIRLLLRHPFRAESAVDAIPRALVFASPADRVIRFAESEAMVRLFGDRAELQTLNVAHADFLHQRSVWQAVARFLATVRSPEDAIADASVPLSKT